MPAPRNHANDRTSQPVAERPAAAGAGDGAHGGDLERVRDILFGEHLRRIDARLQEQRQELEQRLAGLEQRLTEQLSGSTTSGAAALQQATAALRQDLDRRCRELAEEIRREVDRLQESKLDRDALAGLLGGLASRLGKGLAPGAD